MSNITLLFISITAVILCSCYIYYNKTLFTYCSNASIHSSSFSSNDAEFNTKFMSTCNDVFNFDGTPSFYTTLMKVIFSSITDEEISNEDYDEYKKRFISQNNEILLLKIKIIKYCYIGVYIIFLYFGIVLLPKLIMMFVLDFLTLALKLAFLALVFDFVMVYFKIGHITDYMEYINNGYYYIKSILYDKIIKALFNI